MSTAESFSMNDHCSLKTKSPSHRTIERSKTRLWADVSAQEALERTKNQLEQMKNQQQLGPKLSSSIDPRIDARFREYLSFPANALKSELKANGLRTKGRKPDLARRLAEFEYLEENPDAIFGTTNGDDSSTPKDAPKTTYLDPKQKTKTSTDGSEKESSPLVQKVLDTFCGLPVSNHAGTALGRANFDSPTPIQSKALPTLFRGTSAVLHAETGSGKTLAYLLPITEALWKDEINGDPDEQLQYGFVLTPTRELAAQVAGVASALAPPGSVRLVSRPTNLASEGRYWKERRGDRTDDVDVMERETQSKGQGNPPRLFVGSAKAILGSLYGDGRMPASPTRKPIAKELLASTRWMVLDEVDRLLSVNSKKGGLSTAQRNQRARRETYDEEGSIAQQQQQTGPLHEKPAAILTAAVARRTLGRAQIIAASATVGRSLKRELSRVLGLPPREYPRVIRGDDSYDESTVDADGYDLEDPSPESSGHVDRAVTIPESVRNYVLTVDASSTGKLLTSAFFAIKNLNDSGKNPQKILLVLTKNCGISTTNAIGALKHFRCQPEPQSLLDVLQDADGTDQLMDVHRRVSGSDGIGETSTDNGSSCSGTKRDGDGYLLVTGEDTVRGMHLSGLETVVVVGRANGPDEYIHVAGRTGRAGNSGKVVNVVSEPHAIAIRGWETMLKTKFTPVTMEEIRDLE